jgi:hypothetical protein
VPASPEKGLSESHEIKSQEFVRREAEEEHELFQVLRESEQAV